MTRDDKLCAALNAKAEGATHVFVGTGGEPLFLRAREARNVGGDWRTDNNPAEAAGERDIPIDDYIEQMKRTT